MRDRTLVMLALLFLTLTVGAGVNRSLEACNGIIGKPMAPGIKEVYRRQMRPVLTHTRILTEDGIGRGKSVLTHHYRFMMEDLERVKTGIGFEVREKMGFIWGKFFRRDRAAAGDG